MGCGSSLGQHGVMNKGHTLSQEVFQPKCPYMVGGLILLSDMTRGSIRSETNKKQTNPSVMSQAYGEYQPPYAKK